MYPHIRRSFSLILPSLSLFAVSALHAQNIIATDEAVPATMSEYGTAENPAQYIVGSSGPITLDFMPDNYMSVGLGGTYNELYIQSGSTLISPSTTSIGHLSHSTHNRVRVTGAGSSWLPEYGIDIGFHGSNNALEIVDGGTVTARNINIGYSELAKDNRLLLSESASTLTATSIAVGRGGHGNSFEILNGASVVTTSNSAVGWESTASGNWVVIKGEGSSWRHTGVGTLHFIGSNNTLTIADGGLLSVAQSSGLAGIDPSVGNFIQMDGGFLAIQYNEIALVEDLILRGGIRIWNPATETSVIGTLENFDYFFAGWGVEGEAAAFNHTGYSGLAGYTVVSVIPEPSTWGLIFGITVLAAATIHRRRRATS